MTTLHNVNVYQCLVPVHHLPTFQPLYQNLLWNLCLNYFIIFTTIFVSNILVFLSNVYQHRFCFLCLHLVNLSGSTNLVQLPVYHLSVVHRKISFHVMDTVLFPSINVNAVVLSTAVTCINPIDCISNSILECDNYLWDLLL